MTKNNIKYIILESMASSTVFYFTNPFFSMLAKRMGADSYQLSMVNALPALIAFCSLIPGAILIDLCKNKKKAVVAIIATQTIILPIVGLSPFCKDKGIWFFIVWISIMNAPISIYNIGWQSLFSDIFQGDLRITIYSKRTKIYTLIGMIITISSGFILTYIPSDDAERLIIYQSFYIFAFLSCFYQTYLLNKIHNVESPEEQKVSDCIGAQVRNIKEILNKKFIKFTALAFVINGAWYFGHSLFFIYHANYLGSNEMWISVMTVGNATACVITYKFWSDMISKKGNEYVLMLGAFGLALNPLVVVANNIETYVIISTVLSVTFPAFQLGMFECMIKVIDRRHKTLAIAVYTSAISIANFIFPIFGVWIFQSTTIKFAMYFCFVLRLGAASLCYKKLKKIS